MAAPHAIRDFDGVVDVVGGFGRYQKLIVFFVLCPALFPCGFFNFNIVFLAATPDVYGCALPISNFTADDLEQFAPIERRNGENARSRCVMYDLDYATLSRDDVLGEVNRSRGNETSKLKTIPCTNGWVYSKSVYTSTVVTEWDLVCNREVLASVAFAASTLGGLFGTLLWAFLADRYGRKLAYFSMVGFQLAFGVATAFAPNLISFYIFRFASGMCSEFCYTLVLLMALEITGTKTRALMSVICSVAYTASVLVVIGLGYAVRTWNGFALISSAPLFVLALLWPFLPESPRWLLAQKRYPITELEEYLKKVARINGKNLDPKFEADLPEILRKIDESEHAVKTSVADLFRTPNLRKKTLILSFINFCNLGVFSGLNLFEPAFGNQPHYNALLANLVELPPYVFARFACDRGGRRLSLFYPMLLCSIFCLATSGMPASQTTTILGLSLTAKLCITLTFLVAEVYEEELFPTVIRGQGHSFTIVISQIAGIMVPFVVMLGQHYAVLPLIVFGILCIIAAASVLFLPETAGKELPQTLQDGESFGEDMTWKKILTLVPTRRRKGRRASQ
ncbi:Carcinine [Hypsibius exemplaris]|uniref:Carcinine n=1 Tax=Hypsibius exemplaris TaxID=2072580 RepID=A0A1W0WWW2_HYPEX|nr:Carcinine [Hypsibius exemplaris]